MHLVYIRSFFPSGEFVVESVASFLAALSALACLIIEAVTHVVVASGRQEIRAQGRPDLPATDPVLAPVRRHSGFP